MGGVADRNTRLVWVRGVGNRWRLRRSQAVGYSCRSHYRGERPPLLQSSLARGVLVSPQLKYPLICHLLSFCLAPLKTTGHTRGQPGSAYSFQFFPRDTATVVGQNSLILCRKDYRLKWIQRILRSSLRSEHGCTCSLFSSFTCKMPDSIDSRLATKVIFQTRDSSEDEVNPCTNLFSCFRFPCTGCGFMTIS